MSAANASIVNDDKYVILSAKFKAENMLQREVLSRINQYAEIRRNTQPLKEPSLGSVFKRANEISAGYFVDKLGLKGFSCGDAIISTKHAGFIVNAGNASASDVIKLINYIKKSVESEFGITLEEEIEIIALLILLHVEENGYFDRSEYDIDYRSISTLETESIHSSKTTFKFYLHEDDFSNNELKSLANREMPRIIKHHTYERASDQSWQKTNTTYYYTFDKLIDLRDFDSLIVGMF